MADIFGTTGDDVLNGTAFDDIITTYAGNDTVAAGDGDDLIVIDEASTGTIDGGAGFDTVRVTTSLFVSFSNGGFPEINTAGRIADVFINPNAYVDFTSIERLEVVDPNSGDFRLVAIAGGVDAETIDLSGEVYSSDFLRVQIHSGGGDDVIILGDSPGFSATSSQVLAGDGDDTIMGGSGHDLIQGLQGSDTMTGGLGADVFMYETSGYDGGFSDFITDFSIDDSLQFFTDYSGATGSFSPIFIGTDNFSNAVGELRYFTDSGQTLLELDIDGDGVADETLTITNGEFELEESSQTIFGGGLFSLSIVVPPINGTSGADTLLGTSGDDTINGYGGDDVITTFAGDDTIAAGTGNDTIIIDANGLGSINGQAGYDTIEEYSDSGFSTLLDEGTGQSRIFTSMGFYDLIGVEEFNDYDLNGVLQSRTLFGFSTNDTLDASGLGAAVGLSIWAGAGNDILIGGSGYQQLFAGSGDDSIITGTGFADIRASAGSDSIDGTAGYVRIQYYESNAGININLSDGLAESGGYAEGDILTSVEAVFGSNFADILTGSSANEEFSGYDGNDIIDGGGGDDSIGGESGQDTLTGGAGADNFYFNAYGQGAFSDTITDFEIGDYISMQTGVVTFIGSSAFTGVSNELRYEKIGGETLLHLDIDGDQVTDETLTISNGEFDIKILSNNGLLRLEIAPPPINGTSGSDTLLGTTENDLINGFGGDDIITTLSGNDTVDAGDGDDTIIVDENGQGAVDGGAGVDLVQLTSDNGYGYSYYSEYNDTFTLSTAIGGYTLQNVERVEVLNSAGDLNYLVQAGGVADDTLDISADNVLNQASLYGFGGNDTLTGGSSYTDLYGGDGDDMLNAGSGYTALYGGDGNDTLNAGTGGSYLEGGLGADTITASSGYDYLSYLNSDVGVTIDLFSGAVGIGGHAEGDILSGSFEAVYGSSYADTITGGDTGETIYSSSGDDVVNSGDGNDQLYGDTGNDTLNGGDGDDNINGGSGGDTLTGGSGNDTFTYYEYDGAFADSITDFEIGDRLDIQQGSINGTYILPIFIGTDAFNGVSGEMRYEKTGGQTLIHLDTDGDGNADQTLTLSSGEHDLQISSNNNFSYSFEITIVPPPINGTSSADTLLGTSGDDIINGFAGDDIITTLAGNDTIKAGSGDDLIVVDENGSGSISGQPGFDTVQVNTDGTFFFNTTGGQDRLLTSINVNGGQYELVTLERVERYDAAGSTLRDVILTGTAGIDTFDLTNETTAAQNWNLFAGSGDDAVTLGSLSGFYQIYLGSGDDTYLGSDTAATVFVYSGTGNDTLTGGANSFEYLIYTDSDAGVNIDLSLNMASGGHAEGDIISGFDSIYGSTYDDVLIGNAGNNIIWGNQGDDVIEGGAGADTLFVSLGTQTLTGGVGADSFNYFSISIGGSLNSEITDLEIIDNIFISRGIFDGINRAPTFIGSEVFSNIAGEMRYEATGGETLVQLDIDGDGIADETLTISNGEFDLETVNETSFGFNLQIAAPPSTIVTNTLLEGEGSLADALEDANTLAGPDTITFDPNLTGMDIFLNGQTSITGDIVIDGDIDGNGSSDITIQAGPNQNGRVFDVSTASLSIVNEADINVDTSGYTGFARETVFYINDIADDVVFTNSANITQSGDPAQPNLDRDIALDVWGDNFTLINEAGASIVTEGRSAISAIGGFLPDGADFTTNIINNGLLEAGDDTIRITSGTITNNGTIRTTGTYDFGNPDFNPGYAADGIAVFGLNEATTSLPAEGVSHIINSATGVIEGARSGVSSGGGTVDNAGYIVGEVVAIWAQGHSVDGLESNYTVNNSGTLERLGEEYGFNGGAEAYATIFVGANIDAATITNSGTILSPDLTISAAGAGTSLTNEATGQILSDTDTTGDDGVAFRGAQLEDFLVESSTSFFFTQPNQIFENSQGITVDANGDFVIPGVGTIPNPNIQIEVAFVGADNPLLPLVDIAATQNSGVLTFQTDANGVVYPATIDVTSSNLGTLTINWISGSGLTVTDVNGNPVYNIPQGIDYGDTIDNQGIINGDITTDLDNDVITNTGVIDGDVSLGRGDDSFTSTGANGGFDLTVDGGSGDDYIQSGDNNDILNGEAGDDTLYGDSGNDNLRGEAGNDTLDGGDDNDIVDGGNGEDIIDGGSGDDTLRGGGDDDAINGGVGSDSISAGIGNDTVYGGGNNDTILGQGGADTLYGDGGADTLRGGSGNDTLYGGDGADTLFGQGNNDILYGEGGNDTLIGAAGSDQLFGGDGNDILNGSVGADRLDGGAGNDILNGGGADGARDTFVFAEGYDEDRINSFDQAGNDRLELDDALWAGAGTLTAQEVVDMFGSLNATGTILTLDFGNGDILEIQNGAGIDMDTFGEDILVI